ncbi:uncharacterized protein LOC132706074 [Cylas formicarius]|uniref:uncharacterized protein LOC132706074 n=1 Tax=Cylas formicarius TaxID=197179 RepID=UPI002958A86D|nr:uncharacterized protein LOC132706074 [Cylas formicarius]
MSSEIEVPETPNWLKDLEEKREKRLKARLGHEAGAGAPCLKCEDKCPGLDLHFWRKACKICRCPKEEHDVHDDDIYGWAQFQLLGSKPNKIRTKIVLPGKKDEVELEWAPKGQKDTIDKYLKTLDPGKIPIKGSHAAQERRQMLQKQIPIHDIDPSLCHELNEDEVHKMKEYIAHVKNSSVGVGQIVNLSNVIKASIHNISPQEAHIIASHYAKDIPYSEIVKLEAGLAKKLERMAIHDPKNKKGKLLSMVPSEQGHKSECVVNPSVANKIKDINYGGYADTNSKPSVNAQYGIGLNQSNGAFDNPHPRIDETLLQGTNFDPAKTPSQFPGYKTRDYKPYPSSNHGDTAGMSGKDINNAGVGDNVPFTSSTRISEPIRPADVYVERSSDGEDPHGLDNKPSSNSSQSYLTTKFEGAKPLNHTPGSLPHYGAHNYDIRSDSQNPTVPRNVKDLIYSTFDPSDDASKTSHGESSSLNPIARQPSGFPNGLYQSEQANTNKTKKPLSHHHPSGLNIPEDYLEPSNIKIGLIRDAPYSDPKIREAVTGQNDFDKDYNEDYSPDSIREILNNIKLPECHYCKKPFEENEFAVTIERAKFLFHAGCFKCAGCNQNLADNIYFYHKETNNVYCGRDYAKIRGYPRCDACDELIFTKEYCLAENSTFHLKHFCCFQCDTPLAGQEYTLEEEKPYCLPCFESSKASKCNTCLSVIKPDEMGCNLNEVHFHATEKCVACIVCGAPLMGKKLLLRNNKLYCSHDCFRSISK